MKNLHRLTAFALSVAMLGAAACTSCMPSTNLASPLAETPVSYTCGANTTLVGNQCIANKNLNKK